MLSERRNTGLASGEVGKIPSSSSVLFLFLLSSSRDIATVSPPSRCSVWRLGGDDGYGEQGSSGNEPSEESTIPKGEGK